MRLHDNPHFTRQDRTQLLQSVAFTPGTGKSHLLIGCGRAAVNAGFKVRYFTAADLIETLYRGLADNTVGKIIDSLLRADLLIVDEIGFAPLDDTGTQLLFRLVAAGYERRSLAIASHWPFSKAHLFVRTCAKCCRNITGSCDDRVVGLGAIWLLFGCRIRHRKRAMFGWLAAVSRKTGL
jgi:DNA replication protein DnaC